MKKQNSHQRINNWVYGTGKSLSGWHILLFCLTLVSCKKLVGVDPPKTQIVSADVFSSDASATSALRGIYSQMTASSGFASGGTGSVSFLCSLSADELTNYSSSTDLVEFYANALTKTNPSLYTSLWQEPYNYIVNANYAINGLNGSATLTPSVKSELLGEAKFIRAFCNFYLVNLFGDVPLVTSTDYAINATASRTPKDQVYQQIVQDLKEAQMLLSDDFSFAGGNRDQPNKGAATALLARVYLYIGQWSDAEAQASQLINNSSTYQLLSDPNAVFLKNSPEAIWQLKPVATDNTLEGNLYILISRPDYVSLNSDLVHAFEPGDLRRVNWIGSYINAPDTFYFANKYKIKNGSPDQEYTMVLRLAEQYLIRAEARVKQNNLSGALQDLNKIRSRAGLPDLTASSQNELLQDIEQERRVELFTEWGHRWLDLKRTGRIDAIMTVSTPKKGNTWNAYQKLYPIPQADISRDHQLSQNPGY